MGEFMTPLLMESLKHVHQEGNTGLDVRVIEKNVKRFLIAT